MDSQVILTRPLTARSRRRWEISCEMSSRCIRYGHLESVLLLACVRLLFSPSPWHLSPSNAYSAQGYTTTEGQTISHGPCLTKSHASISHSMKSDDQVVRDIPAPTLSPMGVRHNPGGPVSGTSHPLIGFSDGLVAECAATISHKRTYPAASTIKRWRVSCRV